MKHTVIVYLPTNNWNSPTNVTSGETQEKTFSRRQRVVTRTGVFSHVINADDTEDGATAHHQLFEDSQGDIEMSVDDDQDLDEEQLCLEAEKSANKKKRQWAKWNDDVIPGLLRPYVDLLWATDNLRNVATICRNAVCRGCQLGRLLEIFCVFFDSMFSLILCCFTYFYDF